MEKLAAGLDASFEKKKYTSDRIENLGDAIKTILSSIGEETKPEAGNTFDIYKKELTASEITDIITKSYDLFREGRKKEKQREDINIMTEVYAWYRDVPEKIASNHGLPVEKTKAQKTVDEYYHFLEENRHRGPHDELEEMY